MMAGNPNWWSMHPPSLFPPQYVQLGSSSLLPFNTFADTTTQDPPPQSWSQLLLGGLSTGIGEDYRLGPSQFQPKKSENWEDQIFVDNNNPTSSAARLPLVVDVKQELSQKINDYVHSDHESLLQQTAGHTMPVAAAAAGAAWSTHFMPVSSPTSCITTTSLGSNNNNMLDFSYNKTDIERNTKPDYSPSKCNSTATVGVVCKKARVHPSASQPPLKVRKEKLGDRITALHQLVSPFGKTDTASVLLEAIGYIRFLQSQIEALSSPYLGDASKNMRNQQYVQGGERNCVFPEDPGQLLNDNCLKRKGVPDHHQLVDNREKPKDLRSRGLCLVPVSCTQNVGSEINGADYWAPAYGSGF
ncbi:transcription factor bHLH68 isoform X1 [Ziziphus jujuba]|uniref:Transcription factor bHLH68 isoform X1 n=1 Tax=Ziziphus jujuba TaxID=326968 RepID=A0ABM3IDF0_ZIZJJ|nr:transcription factor bHLH68 isoform X1 [Ziziphus jujuba]